MKHKTSSMIPRIALAGLLAGVSTAASAFSFWGDDRPSIVVVSEFHGSHKVFIDQEGLPYHSGNNVPYVVQTACRYGVLGDFPSSSCGQKYGQLFDGVEVSRVDQDTCSVKETTIRHFEMVRSSGSTAALPNVEVHEWRVNCADGIR